jgi:hypothetical protein
MEDDMWHAWGSGKMFTGFWLGGPKIRDLWEDLDIGGRITLRWALGIDEVNWTRLAQDRVRWRAFLSAVMNLRVL